MLLSSEVKRVSSISHATAFRASTGVALEVAIFTNKKALGYLSAWLRSYKEGW
jgi:hypothetical protein